MSKFCLKICSFNEDYLSYEAVRQQKGLYAIFIFLYHLALSIDYSPILKYAPGWKVTAFYFFFSGYGCMFGYMRKDNYDRNFLKKRILPIVTVYIIVFFIYMIAFMCMGNAVTAYSIFGNMFVYGEPLVRYSWYVLAILLFYIFFFIVMKVAKSKNTMIAGFAILWSLYVIAIYTVNWGRHWYDTSVLFIVGMIWAYKEDKIKEIARLCLPLILVLVKLLFEGSKWLQHMFKVGKKGIAMYSLHQIGLVLAVIAITMFIKVSIPFLGFFGDISLEILICQGLSFSILSFLEVEWPVWGEILFCISVTLALACPLWCLRKMIGRWAKQEANKRKPA